MASAAPRPGQSLRRARPAEKKPSKAGDNAAKAGEPGPSESRFHSLNPRRAELSAGEDGAARLAAAERLHVDDLSSDDEEARNTAGPAVPRAWYADEAHVGYDLSGQRIARAERGDGIDRFLRSADDPQGFRWSVYDEEHDEEITLSKRDLQIIKRLRGGDYAHPEFDPYADDYNTTGVHTDGAENLERHSLHAGTEPKRRFLPSRHEELRINAIVRAIRSGRFQRQKELARRAREGARPRVYLMWGDDGNAIGSDPSAGPSKGMPPPLPAPKQPLPGHAASYNPPPEYLMTAEEREAWEKSRPRDRALDCVPRRFAALRQVPAYEAAVRGPRLAEEADCAAVSVGGQMVANAASKILVLLLII